MIDMESEPTIPQFMVKDEVFRAGDVKPLGRRPYPDWETPRRVLLLGGKELNVGQTVHVNDPSLKSIHGKEAQILGFFFDEPSGGGQYRVLVRVRVGGRDWNLESDFIS